MKLECPDCGAPCENHGAESRGDGDMYDAWHCPKCLRRCFEVHASYCECVDCEGHCGKVHRVEDDGCYYVGDPY